MKRALASSSWIFVVLSASASACGGDAPTEGTPATAGAGGASPGGGANKGGTSGASAHAGTSAGHAGTAGAGAGAGAGGGGGGKAGEAGGGGGTGGVGGKSGAAGTGGASGGKGGAAGSSTGGTSGSGLGGAPAGKGGAAGSGAGGKGLGGGGSGAGGNGAGGSGAGAGGASGGVGGGSVGLADSANSIVVASSAGRADPEGVAPPAPSIHDITWNDARSAARKAALYGYLYQYDFSFVGGVAGSPTQVTSRSASDDAYGHPGFGFVVSHNTQTGNSPLGKANAPTSVTTTSFVGGHHAIHHIELVYDRDKEGGGSGIKIPVVIEWMVATGRDHPVWSVTWKMGAAANPNGVDFNAYRMDVRGPYGSLNFDGATNKNQGDAIGGVSWGDFAYQFTTTDAELTMNSPWTYDTPNTVNFTRAWTKTTNSEIGIVQTIPGDKSMGYQDQVYGRQHGSTSAAAFPGKGDCTAFGDNRVYSMPCVNGWPYQLMEFDWDPSGGKPLGEATGTKLIAWGAPFGWLGSSAFDLFDYSAKANGTGDRSYAMMIVLGPKCRYSGASCDLDGDVVRARKAVEALAAATITNVTVGGVSTTAPKGPGASDTKTLTNGYDDTYAVYELDATGGQAAFTFTPAPGQPVEKPIFVLRNVASADVPTITVDGAPRTVNTGAGDAGAFVSYRAGANELWVTLNETIGAAAVITIGP